MSLTTLILTAALQLAALSLIMAGAWVVQQRTGNSGFVDAVWTFGLGLVGAVSALVPLQGDAITTRQIVVALIVLAWSLRLGLHVMRRSLQRGDDPRYAKLIEEWGVGAKRRMFFLLQAQAILSLPLVVAMFVAAHNPEPFGRTLDWLGLAIIAIGIVGEAISDRQLNAWLATKTENERICDRGLWRWSRHPNYFFEWVFWLAFPFFAAVFGGGYLFGWLALAAPICMYWLLVHVSGIPPLEEHMVAKHGDAYRAYQARTRKFLPLPKRTDTPL